MNNKNKFRFAILLFGVLSASIITACSDNNSPDDPSQGENTLPVKQVSLSRKTAYGNDWIYYSLEKRKRSKRQIRIPCRKYRLGHRIQSLQCAYQQRCIRQRKRWSITH